MALTTSIKFVSVAVAVAPMDQWQCQWSLLLIEGQWHYSKYFEMKEVDNFKALVQLFKPKISKNVILR